ncbi:hypothetical protein GCM10017744_009020 [Streptomyces antimycoticus]|uniref:Ketoreductase domain-containing protein n=1 Tax=Streptomyces antimycoticus TaxID=68175 RepID=A0A4D4KQT1_9ACTN|nr:SDR family oxidoreductase [Streptomyces antimycoticus]GDY48229.1 hypothetical protein SANT12839_091110 [Streptomyces antimycoticus]
MEFAGKIAVITAGAGGIGRACAAALASHGSTVVIADIDAEGAAQAAEEIRALGRESVGIRCDVTSDREVQALADHVVERFGCVDLLHNHAGIGVAGSPDQIPLEEWERVLQFNVMSQVRGVMAFLPHLKKSRGHVVNTTSSLGVVAGHPISPMVAPYITSKNAIVGMTQCLAEWLRPQGVGVSLLAPDHTATNFDNTVKFYGVPVDQGDDGAAAIEDKVPYGIQQPEEIGRAYVEGLREGRFLLSSTPDVADLLRRQAEGLLDPSALHGVYV